MKQTVTTFFALMFITSSAFASSGFIKPKLVDSLIDPYLDIQKALAADDLENAQSSAVQFVEVLKNEPSVARANLIAEKLLVVGINISQAQDLASARATFLELSNVLTSLIKQVGTSDSAKLFVVHCPMAFQGKGGDWLQSDKTVMNPYYGSMMLHCGSVQTQIAGN